VDRSAAGVRVTAQAPSSFLGHCDHSCAASPGSPKCCGLYYHIAALRGAVLPITLGGDLVEVRLQLKNCFGRRIDLQLVGEFAQGIADIYALACSLSLACP